MRKKMILPMIFLILFFSACENQKNKKQQSQNTVINNKQTENINMPVASSNQPAADKLKVTMVIADEKKTDKKSKIKVTFVELGSVRCIPCKMMQPIMKEIEEKYGDEVKVVFYDVWTEAGRPYAEKYGIRAIPTQVFLDENGKEFFRHVGFFPREELFDVLKKKGVNIK